MAVQHIAFNDQLPHGRMLRRSLQQMEEGMEGLRSSLATLATMIDGDGTVADHFAYTLGKFGFSDVATAKAAYDELLALRAKLSTNAQVTQVGSALTNAFNRFR